MSDAWQRFREWWTVMPDEEPRRPERVVKDWPTLSNMKPVPAVGPILPTPTDVKPHSGPPYTITAMIPLEPPIGSVVLDSRGVAWQREALPSDESWSSANWAAHPNRMSWANLLVRSGNSVRLLWAGNDK